MSRLFLLIALLQGAVFMAQGRNNPDPDSLKQLLVGAEPQKKVELLFMLSESTLPRSPEEAIRYAQEGLLLAEELNDRPTMVKAYDILGKSHYYTGQLFEAISNFEHGLALARQGEDSSAVGYLHNSLGVAFKKQGDYQEALLHFYRSLKIWEESGGNLLKTASILSNIASLHFHLKQYDKSLELYERAMPIMEEFNDKRGLSYLYNNLGEVHSGQNDYDKALEFYRKSLTIKQEMGLQTRAISTLTNMGLLFSRQSQYDSALHYYNIALNLAQAEQNPYWLQKLYESKAEISRATGDYALARIQYNQSLDAARNSGTLPAMLELEEKLSEINEEMGDFGQAYLHLKSAHALRDTLFSKETHKMVSDVEARHELEQKEQKIQTMKREDELNKLKQTILVMISIFFILGFFTLYNRFREKKKAASLLEFKNEAIREKNVLLEKRSHEIGQQNTLLKDQSQAIQRQNRLLKQSNTDLEQFAYVASHDLREPLRTIRSYMQLLKQRYGTQLDENAQTFINFAHEGAERMDILLKDLLDYARIGRDQRPSQPVALNAVLDRVTDSIDHQITESGAKIDIGELPTIQAHETLMEQLFQNLLSNAIKFRREDSPRIQVRSQAYNGKTLISVTDNGIGIPSKYKDKVFTIFQRLHTQEQYQGTGIGLAICKRIAEKHNGELWFESEVGTGTTFYFSFPSPEQTNGSANRTNKTKRTGSTEPALGS